jgi:2-polyprenyl-3-methyl-5-hydroxy-6-metoxy-1,4-benzoquinol methylase
MNQNSPLEQIYAGNPWYLTDQFLTQYFRSGHRRIIENRWTTFAEIILGWRANLPLHELKVLDAGCGDGINLLGLSKLSDTHNLSLTLHGVDYNPIRLDRALNNVPSATLQCASLLNLPYGNSTYDVVLCSHTLEHIPDCRKALAELMRVIRPGGLLIIAVPNEGCLMARLRNYILQPSISQTTDHVHFFTEETLSSLLKKSGFTILSIQRETFFFPHSYLNFFITEFPFGHSFMNFLRRFFPSQAGGLITSLVKPSSLQIP